MLEGFGLGGGEDVVVITVASDVANTGKAPPTLTGASVAVAAAEELETDELLAT